MSYFQSFKPINASLRIDNIAMPWLAEPTQVEYEPISTGGRLPDDITYEGRVVGTKRKITCNWGRLNKADFDLVFNNTIAKYLVNNPEMFMSLTVNTYSPEGIITIDAYIGASGLSNKCVDTTEKFALREGRSNYAYGGADYDELHKEFSITFIEK